MKEKEKPEQDLGDVWEKKIEKWLHKPVSRRRAIAELTIGGVSIGVALKYGDRIGRAIWDYFNPPTEETVPPEKIPKPKPLVESTATLTETGSKADLLKTINEVYYSGKGKLVEVKDQSGKTTGFQMNVEKKTLDDTLKLTADYINSKKKQLEPKFDLNLFKQACKRFKLDPKKVLALMLWESRLNPNEIGRCRKGVIEGEGLYQIMPDDGKNALREVVRDLVNTGGDDAKLIWDKIMGRLGPDETPLTKSVEFSTLKNIVDTIARKHEEARRQPTWGDVDRIAGEIKGLERSLLARASSMYDFRNPNQVWIGLWMHHDNLRRLDNYLSQHNISLSEKEKIEFFYPVQVAGWTETETALDKTLQQGKTPTYENVVGNYQVIGDFSLPTYVKKHKSGCKGFQQLLMKMTKN